MTRLRLADNTARGALRTALEDLGETPEEASLAITVPQTYLRSFLNKGVPPVLPSRVRRRLAHHLGIPEFCLGD
jgi:hypothetical protein